MWGCWVRRWKVSLSYIYITFSVTTMCQFRDHSRLNSVAYWGEIILAALWYNVNPFQKHVFQIKLQARVITYLSGVSESAFNTHKTSTNHYIVMPLTLSCTMPTKIFNRCFTLNICRQYSRWHIQLNAHFFICNPKIEQMIYSSAKNRNCPDTIKNTPVI